MCYNKFEVNVKMQQSYMFKNQRRFFIKFNFDRKEGVLEISTTLSSEYVLSKSIIGNKGEIKADRWVFIQIYKPGKTNKVAIPSIKLDFDKDVANTI